MTKEKTAPNEPEVKAQRLGEYRAGYYSSEMIAAMVKEAFKRGHAALSSRAACGSFEEIIQKSVDAIEYDLGDRRGFKHLMSDIREDSPEVYKEILEVWRAELNKMFLAGQKSKGIKLPDATYEGLITVGRRTSLCGQSIYSEFYDAFEEFWLKLTFNQKQKLSGRVEFYAVKSLNECDTERGED